MRIYRGQYNLISSDVIKELLKKELIDVAAEYVREAEEDVVGVLREYNRMARQIINRARDLAGEEGRRVEMRIRRKLAREKNFEMGDEALDYIVNQIIATFEYSGNIEEIYGTDNELRAVVSPILIKYTEDREGELDEVVRSKIKNLEEGAAAWDIEYERVMEKMRTNLGMDTE